MTSCFVMKLVHRHYTITVWVLLSLTQRQNVGEAKGPNEKLLCENPKPCNDDVLLTDK
jgi:hypothetical protein